MTKMRGRSLGWNCRSDGPARARANVASWPIAADAVLATFLTVLQRSPN